MALVVYDRVQETTNTTGTGAVTLAGAVTGFQSFAVVGNGNTTFYFPLASSILFSVVLTIILNIIVRLFRK